MTSPDAGGAAFNAAVHTQDHAPEPDEAEHETSTDETDSGPVDGKDQG